VANEFTRRSERSGRYGHITLAVVAFAASRLAVLGLLVVLFADQADSDLELYARYADAYVRTAARGASIYDEVKIEYPGLALAPMIVPRLLVDRLVGGSQDPVVMARWYRVFYRIQIAVVDIGCFALVVWLIERLFRDETAWQRGERLFVFVCGGATIFTAMYARLDYPLGGLLALSLALLLSGRPYVFSFAVLALAIDYKVAPVALAPLWVLVSLPASRFAPGWGARSLSGLLFLALRRSVVLALLVLVGLVPFYLADWSRLRDFFAYHRERGIEIESLYASAILAARCLGHGAAYDFSFGSLNIRSPVAPLLAAVSPWVVGGLLLATTLGVGIAARRTSAGPGTGTVAQRRPGEVILGMLLVLLCFILGNKVLSPQYLLWVIPLVPLAPLPLGPRRIFFYSFLAACAVTKVLGTVFSGHIVGHPLGWSDGAMLFSGPTSLGVAVLLTRNAILLASVAVLGWYAWRRWVRFSGGAPVVDNVGTCRNHGEEPHPVLPSRPTVQTLS
jgi:hypothetical protein